MITVTDPGPRKRRTPDQAGHLPGRIWIYLLIAVYHVGSAAQWLAEITLMISGGWLAGLDEKIQDRRNRTP
jgi:hypothetical protein